MYKRTIHHDQVGFIQICKTGSMSKIIQYNLPYLQAKLPLSRTKVRGSVKHSTIFLIPLWSKFPSPLCHARPNTCSTQLNVGTGGTGHFAALVTSILKTYSRTSTDSRLMGVTWQATET